MTDHKSKAEELTKNVLNAAAFNSQQPGVSRAEFDSFNVGCDRELAAAQVHAILHLGEQQRLGNQIAYAMLLEAQYAQAAKNPAQYDHDSRPASIARHTLVLEQIREGLGL